MLATPEAVMKKINIGIICLMLMLIFSACSKEKDSFDYYCELIDNEYNGEILVYGYNTMNSQKPFTLINEISEETLNGTSGRDYRAIVVWNPDGKFALSDQELLLIKDYVDNKQYDFFYIGSAQFDTLVKLNFTSSFGTSETGMLYSGYNMTTGIKNVNAFTDEVTDARNTFAHILFQCYICITTN
jgi:hypothetical protein